MAIRARISRQEHDNYMKKTIAITLALIAGAGAKPKKLRPRHYRHRGQGLGGFDRRDQYFQKIERQSIDHGIGGRD